MTPDAADGGERQGQGVVAAVDLEAGGRLGHHGAPEATSPVASLTATMLATSRASCRMSRGPIRRPDADRDVVEDDRQVARLGHGPEVGRQPAGEGRL